jgi:hypothetical protein
MISVNKLLLLLKLLFISNGHSKTYQKQVLERKRRPPVKNSHIEHDLLLHYA